jgi:hypothetical protein
VSLFHGLTHRVAQRAQRPMARAFSEDIQAIKDAIDMEVLESEIAAGAPVDTLFAVVMGFGLTAHLDTEGVVQLGHAIGAQPRFPPNDLFERLHAEKQWTSAAVGQGSMDVLEDVTGLSSQFNAMDVQMRAANIEGLGQLVTGINRDMANSISFVTLTGADRGITVERQAMYIREMVGLPAPWRQAPANFEAELFRGRINRGRLLHDPLRPSGAMVRELEQGIAAGRHRDGRWVNEMRNRYAQNLVNRRAINIARTESARASMNGLRHSWRQSQRQGQIPADARRVPVVTPDDLLREDHLQAMEMNMPDGVGLDEPYDTPWGPQEGVPWEADPYLCRCGETLIFPGLRDPGDTPDDDLADDEEAEMLRTEIERTLDRMNEEFGLPEGRIEDLLRAQAEGVKMRAGEFQILQDFNIRIDRARSDWVLARTGLPSEATEVYRHLLVRDWIDSSNRTGAAFMKAWAEPRVGFQTTFHRRFIDHDAQLRSQHMGRQLNQVSGSFKSYGLTNAQMTQYLNESQRYSAQLFNAIHPQGMTVHRATTRAAWDLSGVAPPVVGETGTAGLNPLSAWATERGSASSYEAMDRHTEDTYFLSARIRGEHVLDGWWFDNNLMRTGEREVLVIARNLMYTVTGIRRP